MIKLQDKSVYELLYQSEVLSKLDPQKTFDELGDNAILLCHEKADDILTSTRFCHRRMVAEWFHKHLGVVVEELT